MNRPAGGRRGHAHQQRLAASGRRKLCSDGRSKAGDGADTADGGTLTKAKADAYADPHRIVIGLDLEYGKLGIDVSARAGYGATVEDCDVPQGNTPSGYAANRPLSDRGFDHRNRFSGFTCLDACVCAHFTLGVSTGQDVRLGRQTITWGDKLFIQHIHQDRPADYITPHRLDARRGGFVYLQSAGATQYRRHFCRANARRRPDRPTHGFAASRRYAAGRRPV